MRGLRILLGCGQAPLPEGSAAGRWCYALIKGLAGRGHRVTAFTACKSASEARAVSGFFHAPGSDVRCFVSPLRGGIAAKLETLRRPHSYPFSTEAVHQWRAECARGYDIVHLEGTWSGWLAGSERTPRTILNVHNLYSIDWVMDTSRAWHERMRRSLSVRAERQLIGCFPNLLAVSPELAAKVAQLAPRSTVHVVPLALDLDRYDFIPQEKRPLHPVVALIGSMDWPSSKYAAERLLTRLWPEILKRLPHARLQITGSKARSALREYLKVPGVEIHEDVASTQPYFESASVLLYAPERGSGMKVKVLEAFAYGLPVVTTPPGIEGLDVEDKVHIGIHETDEGLIERVLGLLRDSGRQEAQRRAARHLVELKYTPAAIIERLENVYATILDGSRPQADRAEGEVSNQYAGCR